MIIMWQNWKKPINENQSSKTEEGAELGQHRWGAVQYRTGEGWVRAEQRKGGVWFWWETEEGTAGVKQREQGGFESERKEIWAEASYGMDIILFVAY